MKDLWKKITKNKVWFGIVLIALIVTSLASVYLLYSLSLLSGIENFLRLCGSIVIVIIWIIFFFFSIRVLVRNKKVGYILFILIAILYSAGLYFVSSNIDRVVGKIGNISSNSTTYSSSIVTLKENSAESIEDIGDAEIGFLNDENSVEGYTIPLEIASDNNLENNLVEYDSFVALLQDLYEEEIEYVFLPTNYAIKFSNIEGFSDLEEKTKIIYTQSQEVKNTTNVSKNKKLDEPFTILLMGVDSELESIKGASFNGDSLMLITFNPTTLNSTILSIPRDTYVPISCFSGKRKNKITHAAWYGEDCMINTIQDFTGITIDYYVKINFKGVVKLVDTLGGIEVDVPFSFCEQNSNREWGENTIYVEKGLQTLNGEQALALARNRHPNPSMCSSKWTNYTSNDFIRGQNQQLVVKALLNKIKDIRSLDTVYELLDALSENMETNMSRTEILSLYDIAKTVLLKSQDTPVEELIGMQRLYLSGTDANIYDYNPLNGQGTKMRLYNFLPYTGSIEDISTAMKINLGLQEEEPIKEFSFSVDTPYEETVIGRGSYSSTGVTLLRDLTGYTESEAKSYGAANGITITSNYVKATSPSQRVGQVIDQSVPYATDLAYVKSLTITVINEAYTSDPIEEEDPDDNNDSNTKLDCSLKENATNSKCAMPTFIGEDISFVRSWFRNQGYSILVTYKEIKPTDSGYDESKALKVTAQSTTNAYLYDYIGTGKEFVITYMGEKITDDEGLEDILPSDGDSQS